MSQHHWPPTLRDMVVMRRIVPLIAVEVEAKMSFCRSREEQDQRGVPLASVVTPEDPKERRLGILLSAGVAGLSARGRRQLTPLGASSAGPQTDGALLSTRERAE